jgi:hypothetical protein
VQDPDIAEGRQTARCCSPCNQEHIVAYRITGLSPEPFKDLWSMQDDALAALNTRRVIADSDRGFPCRISLLDAGAGETLLLLPYQHHDVEGPYRASGPIFIRQQATAAASFQDRIPPFFLHRLLSVRGYDRHGWMHAAEVVEGTGLEAIIASFFERGEIAYLHIHNARPGCYACRVDRD